MSTFDDRFDEALEAEVQRLTNPGDESRRAAAVASLHSSSQVGVFGRVAAVTLAITAMLALFYLLGTTLALQAATGLCRAVGLCG